MIQCCRMLTMATRCARAASLEVWPAPDDVNTIYSCDEHVGDLIPDHPCVVAPIGLGSVHETEALLTAYG